jgi:DNA polymerase III epsilon subunit-like protein
MISPVKIFCDIETTGLDPSRHEIISICIITEYPLGSSTWSALIKPRHIWSADQVALDINGYNEEAWASGIDIKEAAEMIDQRINGGLFIGYNPSFDMSFIRKALKDHGYETPRVRMIDVMTLAHEHLIGIKRLSLYSVRKYLGMSTENSHTALQDTRDTRAVYNLLHRCSSWKRIGLYLMWKIRGLQARSK